jgi:hypothetical protein
MITRWNLEDDSLIPVCQGPPYEREPALDDSQDEGEEDNAMDPGSGRSSKHPLIAPGDLRANRATTVILFRVIRQRPPSANARTVEHYRTNLARGVLCSLPDNGISSGRAPVVKLKTHGHMDHPPCLNGFLNRHSRHPRGRADHPQYLPRETEQPSSIFGGEVVTRGPYDCWEMIITDIF